MSRATELCRLGRLAVLCQWHLTLPAAPPHVVAWANDHATKEQLVDMIVTEEEQCQVPRLRAVTPRSQAT